MFCSNFFPLLKTRNNVLLTNHAVILRRGPNDLASQRGYFFLSSTDNFEVDRTTVHSWMLILRTMYSMKYKTFTLTH